MLSLRACGGEEHTVLRLVGGVGDGGEVVLGHVRQWPLYTQLFALTPALKTVPRGDAPLPLRRVVRKGQAWPLRLGLVDAHPHHGGHAEAEERV